MSVTNYKLKLLFYIISSILASRLYKQSTSKIPDCHSVASQLSIHSTCAPPQLQRLSPEEKQLEVKSAQERIEVAGSCENSSDAELIKLDKYGSLATYFDDQGYFIPYS